MSPPMLIPLFLSLSCLVFVAHLSSACSRWMEKEGGDEEKISERRRPRDCSFCKEKSCITRTGSFFMTLDCRCEIAQVIRNVYRHAMPALSFSAIMLSLSLLPSSIPVHIRSSSGDPLSPFSSTVLTRFTSIDWLVPRIRRPQHVSSPEERDRSDRRAHNQFSSVIKRTRERERERDEKVEMFPPIKNCQRITFNWGKEGTQHSPPYKEARDCKIDTHLSLSVHCLLLLPHCNSRGGEPLSAYFRSLSLLLLLSTGHNVS